MWSSSNLRCFFWVSWIGRWAEILYFWQAPCSTVATGPWSTFGVRKLKKKKHILDFMCIQTWWQRCITQCTEECMVSDSPAHYKSLGIVKKRAVWVSLSPWCLFIYSGLQSRHWDLQSSPHDSNKQPKLQRTDSDLPLGFSIFKIPGGLEWSEFWPFTCVLVLIKEQNKCSGL